MAYTTSAELQPGYKPAQEASDSTATQETLVAHVAHLSHWPGQVSLKTDALLVSLQISLFSKHYRQIPKGKSIAPEPKRKKDAQQKQEESKLQAIKKK